MSMMSNDFFADLDRLRMPAQQIGTRPEATSKAPAVFSKPKGITGEFIKGPIPVPWLSTASRLPGKAPLAVALAIWFEAGRRKSKEVRLTTAILQRFNVNRKAKYTALKSLEKAGLVSVHREPRKNPVVTILDPQGKPDAEGSHQGVPGTTSPGSEQQGSSDDN